MTEASRSSNDNRTPIIVAIIAAFGALAGALIMSHGKSSPSVIIQGPVSMLSSKEASSPGAPGPWRAPNSKWARPRSHRGQNRLHDHEAENIY